MALCSPLTDRDLVTSWSLAVYIPFGTTQFSQEESTKHDIVKRKRREAKIAHTFDESFVRNPAEIQEEEEWKLHLGELTKQDMGQFFRAAKGGNSQHLSAHQRNHYENEMSSAKFLRFSINGALRRNKCSKTATHPKKGCGVS
jgi:hypothetical protein